MRHKLSLLAVLAVLIASIFRGFWPLVAFIVALGAIQLYVYCFPNSRFTQLLGSWFGPYPRPAERQSSYLLRLSGFAFAIMLVLAGFMLAGAYFFRHLLDSGENHPVFVGILCLGLPLLVGTAALGSFLCLVKAIWLRLGDHEPRFPGSDDEGP